MVCYEYLDEGDWLGFQYYTPEVVLTLPSADGTPFNLVAEADSGAAITLLPRSVADATGVVWDSGIRQDLQGVGGSVFTVYVHIFEVQIGEVTVTLPIAIAPTEDFPPLLGRLGLYEQADVLMDNENHATCIGAVTTPVPVGGESEGLDLVSLLGLGVVGLLAVGMVFLK